MPWKKLLALVLFVGPFVGIPLAYIGLVDTLKMMGLIVVIVLWSLLLSWLIVSD
jgi:hypothetical protein